MELKLHYFIVGVAVTLCVYAWDIMEQIHSKYVADAVFLFQALEYPSFSMGSAGLEKVFLVELHGKSLTKCQF